MADERLALMAHLLRRAGFGASRDELALMYARLKATGASDFGVRATVTSVVYHGSVPDPYQVGREVVVTGSLSNGTFVADTDSLSTKCHSKYQPAKSKT